MKDGLWTICEVLSNVRIKVKLSLNFSGLIKTLTQGHSCTIYGTHLAREDRDLISNYRDQTEIQSEE